MKHNRLTPQSTTEQHGFTLLEILVTLVILSITLPALLHSFREASRGQAVSEFKTTALYLLKYRMAEIELLGYPDIGEEDGEFGENSRYRWHSDVQDVESEEIEGLRHVTVTVTWQQQGQEKWIAMNTYIADRQIPEQQLQQQNQDGQDGQGQGGQQGEQQRGQKVPETEAAGSQPQGRGSSAGEQGENQRDSQDNQEEREDDGRDPGEDQNQGQDDDEDDEDDER